MPKKETLQSFVKNLPNMSPLFQRATLNDWNKNTILALGKAKTYAPKDKGTLIKTSRSLKAKIMPNGIKSAFVFTVPYAKRLEKGVDENTGKQLNIKQIVNPNAQSGYSARAVEEQEPFFIKDLKDIISIVWRKI